MNHFCTYFDINYLPRGMCLVESLSRHCPEFELFILCLDDACYDRICALHDSRLRAVRLREFEEAEPDLVSVRGTRTRLEYYYTCGPAFILWVLESDSDISLLTYIDADTYFYSSPAVLFSELSDSSVGITVHRFGVHRVEGRFNVGWLSFRRDENGLACLRWWRERCIEWCYERFEDGKYADQKYLDEWPARFSGVKIIKNHGANVAPWNVKDYRIRWADNRIMVDEDELIFYHFHGFKQITSWLYNTNLGLTFRFPSRVLIQKVYKPYLRSLLQHSQGAAPTASIRRKHLRHPAVQAVRTAVRTLIGIIFRQYIVVIGDNVF